MKKQAIKNFTHFVGFLILFLLCFQFFTYFLERQTLSGSWNYTVKVRGFYQESENSMDVMGFGSSHMYCSFIPKIFYEETGMNSYVLATQEQSVEMSYYYLKEALKTQRPKVVIFETYMFNLYDQNEFNEGASSNAIENLKWSSNKVDMINSIVPFERKQDFFFPLLKYHDFWKTWKHEDMFNRYSGERDEHKGYVYLEGTNKIPDFSEISDTDDGNRTNIINKEDLHYLDKFLSLAKENDISVIFLFSPTQADERIVESQNFIKQYASENKIMYLNMNELMSKMNIDVEHDFYDTGHLNVLGAEKQTRYLESFIRDMMQY